MSHPRVPDGSRIWTDGHQSRWWCNSHPKCPAPTDVVGKGPPYGWSDAHAHREGARDDANAQGPPLQTNRPRDNDK